MHNDQANTTDELLSRPVKSRKRKGSLRKTALLGPGRIRAEAPSTDHDTIDAALHRALAANTLQHDHHPRRLSLVSEHSPSTSPPPAHTSVQPDLASPVISPTSQSYASTTDDDELTINHVVLETDNASYFGPQPSLDLPRRHSLQKHAPSPLSAVPVLDYSVDDAYDYSDTERWGWVVLVVTWVVFAVGMGSCLGVWSWAWDVGQTPYAPPELEDDPTLPIVGYYPALIILTAVMAWVWVVVAWVGMKYFKHAKIQGDD